MCIEKVPSSYGGNVVGLRGDHIENQDISPELLETDIEDNSSDETDEYFSDDESQDVFLDYMWMENEQEFDQEEIRRLEEEELEKECMIAMGQLLLLDEIRQVQDEQQNEFDLSDIAQKSSLNPFAAEFYPAKDFMMNI